MSIWVFGRLVRDMAFMPCACAGDDYEKVAHVKIEDNGTIYVNGELVDSYKEDFYDEDEFE